MKYSHLLVLCVIMLFASQLIAMQNNQDTPPPVPPRTVSLPPKQRPSKPLPIPPGKPAAPAPVSSLQEPRWTLSPLQTAPAAAAASSASVEFEEEFDGPEEDAQTPAATSSTSTLSATEEHSISKIETDVDGIVLILMSIANHGARLGLAAATTKGDQIIGAAITQGVPILKDIGIASLLVANIIKHINRLSKAKPEVRAIAKERILKRIAADEFNTAVLELMTLANNAGLPPALSAPLQKLAQKVAGLPMYIVTKLLNS